MNSVLSKTKNYAGDMPEMSFLWHSSVWAMDNYTFSERSMHEFNDNTG